MHIYRPFDHFSPHEHKQTFTRTNSLTSVVPKDLALQKLGNILSISNFKGFIDRSCRSKRCPYSIHFAEKTLTVFELSTETASSVKQNKP